MSSSGLAAVPARVLWPLTAAVLAIHGWVLVGVPLHGTPPQSPAPVAVTLNTRMLSAPPPPPPSAAAAEPAPAPAAAPAPPPARQKAPAKAAAAKPAPAAVPEPTAESATASPHATPGSGGDDGPGSSHDGSDTSTGSSALFTASAPIDTASIGDPAALVSDATEGAADPAQAHTSAAAPAAPVGHADAPPPATGTAPVPEDTALPASSDPATPTLLARASTQAAPKPPAQPQAPAGALEITPPGATSSLASSTPPPVRLPVSTRLAFDVVGQIKKFNYSASAELLWQHDGQHYQARQELKVLFLGGRTQTSTGDITPRGLLPQRFGDRSRSEKAAHFDYERGRVTFSANNPEVPLVAGTQDRLSIFVQLGALLAGAPERYPKGTRISLATVGASSADIWSFTVGAEETLHLPVGEVRALKLQRLPRRDHDYDQKAELWLAPSLGYLPARIQITQSNGDFADLRLRAHSPP